MSRSCSCSALLSRTVTDAAFRVLPPMARLVMLELVAWASVAPVPGHLRFLASVSGPVSGLLNLVETEVETALATLGALGMLEVEADGKGLWLAGAKVRAARSEAARNNGLRGGRPRKDETPEAAAARRQGRLIMPIPGGRAETQETQAAKTRADDDLPSPSKTIQSSPSSSAQAQDAMALAGELAKLAGIDHGRSPFAPHADTRTVQGWLTAGATPAQLREVVEEVTPRAKAAIGSLAYFGGAVAKATQAAAATAPDAPASPQVLWARHHAAMTAACKAPLGFDAFCRAHGLEVRTNAA